MSLVKEETPEEVLYTTPPPEWPDHPGNLNPDGSRSAFPISKGRLGLWLLICGIVMLFGGFSSAYIVLRGIPSWQAVSIPSVFWGSTLLLLVSSLTIELTRRSIEKGAAVATKRWIIATGILGFLFLAGQVLGWQQLVNAGVYLPSTLHSSFLYILTGMHGLHIVGGLAGLSYVLIHTLNNRYTPSSHEHIDLCATYWHFMDGLWVYLFLMFLLA